VSTALFTVLFTVLFILLVTVLLSVAPSARRNSCTLCHCPSHHPPWLPCPHPPCVSDCDWGCGYDWDCDCDWRCDWAADSLGCPMASTYRSMSLAVMGEGLYCFFTCLPVRTSLPMGADWKLRSAPAPLPPPPSSSPPTHSPSHTAHTPRPHCSLPHWALPWCIRRSTAPPL